MDFIVDNIKIEPSGSLERIGDTVYVDFGIKIEEEFPWLDEPSYHTCTSKPERSSIEISLQDDCVNNQLYNDNNNTDETKDGILKDLYVCTYCDLRFFNYNSLLEHNKIHLKILLAEIKYYQCDTCGLCFAEKSKLILHLDVKHKIKTKDLRKCRICNKKFESKRFNNHVRNCGKSVKCEICEKKFERIEYLRTHIYDVHIKRQEKPEDHKIETEGLLPKSFRKCRICNKKFLYRQFYDHIRTAHGKPVKCEICKKTYKCEKYLKTHISNVHRMNRKIESTCKMCNKMFPHVSVLTTHMRNVHGDGKPYPCDICHSVFKTVPYLRTHKQRVHCFNGQLHLCDVCGKTFISNRRLRIHKINSNHMF